MSAVYLWLRRGAAAEQEAELGAAHLLEHMLFKGAGGHGAAEAATRIEGLGGDLNAYTAYEQTVLHATVPAGREAQAVATLAEMAYAPHLDKAELAREQQVVVEEIRGAMDDPADRLGEELRARVHRGHPYGRPILGTEETVRGLTVEALSRFHRAMHRPEHSLLVVAGPLPAEQVQALAERHLVAPAGPVGPDAPVRGRANSQAGPFHLDLGFEERLVEVGWPLPGLHHPDIAALDLLSTALGDGDASILPRALRDEAGLAIDAWAALENEPDRGMLVVGAMARRGAVGKIAQGLARVLAQVRDEGLSAEALHRARTTILASRMYDRETVDGRAHRLAWYLAHFGDPEAEALYEARVRAVRSDDLLRVARTWLAPEAAVIGAVAPKKEIKAETLGRRFLEGGRSPRARARTETGLFKATLSCGATLVVQPDPQAELAAISVVGVGGMLVEPAARGGLSGIWANVVTRGAGELDARELARLVEGRAGSLRAWRARNSLGLELRFPGTELDLGVSLLGRVMRAPRFPEDEIARSRDDADEAREALLTDDPGGLAMELAWAALYPGHAWGRSTLGTVGSVARVGAAGLRRYHQRGICGRNLVIAMAGAVDPVEAAAWVDRALEGLPPGAPVLPSPPTLPARLGLRRRRFMDREQAHLVLAFPALGHGDPRAPAQRLLEGLLSGQSGRLFMEVREKRGLAYAVDAAAVEGLGSGTLVVTAAVDAERVAEARKALADCLFALQEAPPSEEELDRVKTRIVDGAVLSLQRAGDRAGLLAAAERYGRGAERWRESIEAPRAVGAREVQALARELLRPDRCVEAEVGPQVR